MSARAQQIAERRAALQALCEQQRQQLLYSSRHISADLRKIDRGVAMVRNTRLLGPILSAAGALLLGRIGTGGKLLRLISRGWLLVGTLRGLKRALK